MNTAYIYAEQIEPVFVRLADYNAAIANKADIDGGGTTGGVWYQDTILSDLFPNYKQVIRVLGGQMAIEYGNVELDVHRFVVTSVSGLKVKVGSAEYTVWNEANFNPDDKANVDGSNATGALATTIGNSHTHANKSVLDSITAQDLIDWDNASVQSHNAVTLGANAVGMDLNTSTQVLQFQNGYQLPTTIKLGEYDEAFLLRHSHGNKLVLDNLTQSVIDNSHTHGNKALLDSYNQTNANIADAVSLRHSHINKAILDAITAAYTTADKNTLDALAGIQLEADQANALIRIKDGNGNVLSTLNVAFLNNEGTQFVYNPSNNTLDLINDYGQTLSSIPVSSFVTNLVSNANWNGTTPSRLDFKDNAGTILFSIDYSIANIQGLQTALDTLSTKITQVENNTNNIKIGGRNILLNSLKTNVLAAAPGITYSNNSDNSVTINATAGNSNYVSCGFHDSHPHANTILEDSDDFVISFEIKSANGNVLPNIYLKGGLPYFGITGVLSNTYKRVFYTGKWQQANYIDVNLGFENCAGTYHIRRFKLEKGTKPTDWTPAPEDQRPDFNQTDSERFDFIKNKPIMANYALISQIPNGQLTVNTTTDLVGGYVYLPNGNVTTTLGLATHVLNAIVDGQTAYNWGNHATAGYTTLGAVQNWVLQQVYLTASALNGYVLQSSLTAQLANYATLAGTQTFTGQITFNQAPIVPNGTLGGHTVNLGQVVAFLGAYIPYTGATQSVDLNNKSIDNIANLYTNGYGSAGDWIQAYNERITQFNTTYSSNTYTLSILLANGVQKQTTLQTSATHFTINSGGVLQLNAAIAQKIADSATELWVNQQGFFKGNFQIGGRNLLSDTYKITAAGAAPGNSAVINSDGSLTVTATAGNGNYIAIYGTTDTGAADDVLQNNDDFVISFEVKNTNATGLPDIYVKNGLGYFATTGSLSSSWQRVYYTGKWLQGSYVNLHLGVGNIIGTFSIRRFKLEKGTKPTDWTPSIEDQRPDFNQTDSERFDFIKNKPVMANYALISQIPNGQLTVNTTADLVGGYVYLPSGNVTTTLGLATHVLNAIADGVTAYNWGNHATAGYTNLGAVQNWVATQGFLTANALNGYVLQSSLTAQLANYATLAGTQTFTGQITFNQPPIVPNGSLAGHTVNLGQMQSYVTGLGYQTASQVTAIVNNAVSAIPAPGNGSVVIQGINALTGTATFSMNQSNNVVGSFDLTPATKNEIAAGATAGVQIVGLFGDCQTYFAHHDVSAGGGVDTNEAFYNLLDPHGAQPTVNVSNHHVHGARLILHSYGGVGPVKYIGEFLIEDIRYSEVNPENGQKMEFTWSEESQFWIYVLPN